MATTKRAIKDGIEDAADTVKDVGKKAVDSVSHAAATVGEKVQSAAETVYEKGKGAVQATGEAIEKVGKKVRRQGE